MTNTAYTGNAGSQSIIRTTAHRAAAAPLILIIEDHEDTRFLLHYLLERRGYLVAETGDGEAGVRAAAELQPDLILMDWSLPRMDGLMATRLISEQARSIPLPIVFLSGHVAPAQKREAFAAGCSDYLVKPLDTDQLFRVLERRLQPHARHALAGVNIDSTKGAS